jgi:hypothetical protein
MTSFIFRRIGKNGGGLSTMLVPDPPGEGHWGSITSTFSFAIASKKFAAYGGQSKSLGNDDAIPV